MGDRIAILNVGGVLEQFDTPAHILGHPASDMVADFVGSDRALKRLRVTEIDPELLEHPPVLPPDATLAGSARGDGARRSAARRRRRRERRVVRCGARRRADGDGPVSSRAEPAEATVPLNGKLQDALAKVLLTDLGWVVVVDGARYVGGLTPESVFESLRRSMDISDEQERTADRGIRDPQEDPCGGGRFRAGVGSRGMEVANSLLDLIGNTPLVRLDRVGAESAVRPHRQARDAQPRRQRQGPPGRRHDRRRRARRTAAAGRHHRRAHVGQHRCRPRHRRRAARLPLRLRDARQGERGEDLVAARVRRRGRGVPDRGAARASRLLLLRLRSAHARDPRRVQARPVLEPRQPARSTSGRPDPRSGGRPTGASRISSPASAPAAPSPASPAISSRRTPTCRSSAPTRKARCSPAAPVVRTSSKASAKTSGPPPTTRRSSIG